MATATGVLHTGTSERVVTKAEERRVIVASSVGTVFEWYDFYLYAILAPFFAGLFFPPGNQTAALLGAFGAYAAGFCVLFTHIAMFTYVTFHLAAPPFSLSTVALGWLFVVYLVGLVITPFGGRWIDRYGHRTGLALAMALGAAGALLTLTPWLAVIAAGLALCSSGVFIAQAATSSYIGAVTTRDRALAVGLYSTFYYAGGSVGGAAPSA